jgi:hypothetical protein
MPAIDLTDDELAAVTAAIWRAIEEDRFPRAPRLDPLRSALTKLDPATAPKLPKTPATSPRRQPGAALAKPLPGWSYTDCATLRSRERTLPTARRNMAYSRPIRGAAMTQDVLGTIWFIALLIVAYGLVTGDLCLWRRDN